MKSILTPILACLFFISAQAQVKTPAASPKSTITQEVGLSSITIEYSRPGVKDRTIFGDLVPYDKMWRTGANKNTMVTFSDDVTIGDATVGAGTYALFITPGMEMWDVYFYSDTENWGVPENWDEEKVAAHLKVKAGTMPMSVETMMMDVNNIKNSSATIDLVWADKYIEIPVSMNTDEAVMASIEKTMAGPSGNDFYSAAVYYKNEGKDMSKALTWINKSLEMRGDKFWILRQKSEIQANLKDYKGAVMTAKASMAAAQEAGNMDYVKINEKNIAAWMK